MAAPKQKLMDNVWLRLGVGQGPLTPHELTLIKANGYPTSRSGDLREPFAQPFPITLVKKGAGRSTILEDFQTALNVTFNFQFRQFPMIFA